MNYSVIICSYNPDERLLSRCLNAIVALNAKNIQWEIILVDNNSAPPLNTLPYVKHFLQNTANAKYIVVREQGLARARIAGIETASGEYIVFFDDDNEPDKLYLQALKKLNTDIPGVGAWGPGHVWVDFIDGVETQLEEYARKIFQERHEEYITYANIRGWQECYPFGTGLSVMSIYLQDYIRLVKQGEHTASGRKGNLLSSGEDLQIVLSCIKQSTAAGVSPTLKVNHLITAKRVTFNYLKKLVYGTNISYHKSIAEVLPEYREQLHDMLGPSSKISLKITRRYLKTLISKKTKTLDFISYVSQLCGVYIALNQPVPKAASRITKLLKITH